MDEERERYVKVRSNCDYYVSKVTISADPILNAKDCIVLVMYKGFCRLAFIRISKDKSWTYTDERYCQPVQDVIYSGDKFYAVSTRGELLSFDITPESYSDVKLAARRIRPVEMSYQKFYIVHSNEKDLLMDQRYMSFELEPQSRRTTKVLVFRFDFDKSKWIKKLGDVSLFMGDNSSESVLASSNSGCLPNCIYFTHDYDSVFSYQGVPHGDFGVYNHEYQSFIPIDTTHVATLVRNTGRGRPIWVIPTLKL
ncbi:hypothetical protein RchiOBHm_Chr1g0359461 [Rosa chinensis]|uniref:KIB1-4 beta-propeller domain-containing protein n=1 Tax=Rosa chinensis TaxID=74649 RepID=A0A2P6SIE4_ROSCH|nr:putative F-box protein At5g60060 [Rosa chinensis]PRQ58452.1 hypothetical protein RchiOBHm_Chr1g0359461 [Rosa chinensis]